MYTDDVAMTPCSTCRFYCGNRHANCVIQCFPLQHDFVTHLPLLRRGRSCGHSHLATHCRVHIMTGSLQVGVHALPHSFHTRPPRHLGSSNRNNAQHQLSDTTAIRHLLPYAREVLDKARRMRWFLRQEN